MVSNTVSKTKDSWRPVSEGEGLDREVLTLPGRQMDLVKALAVRGPGVPVALVVMNGGPVDLSWAQGSAGVGAILAAGFPGQVRGCALLRWGGVGWVALCCGGVGWFGWLVGFWFLTRELGGG